jgi:hypothetical protein
VSAQPLNYRCDFLSTTLHVGWFGPLPVVIQSCQITDDTMLSNDLSHHRLFGGGAITENRPALVDCGNAV